MMASIRLIRVRVSMKKKILYIHHGKAIGGASLSLLYLIEKARLEYDVKVLFLFNSSAVTLFRDHGIPCEVLKKHHPLFIHSAAGGGEIGNVKKYPGMIVGWIYFAFNYANKVLRRENPDIVHLNSTFLTDWLLAAKRARIPVIVHVREPLGGKRWGLRRNIIRGLIKRSATKIIAISKDNADRVGLPALTKVIYNYVDLDVFNPFLFDQQDTGISQAENIRIAYMGGQENIKGFNCLVDALILLDENVEVHFAGYYYRCNGRINDRIKLALSKEKRKTMRNLDIMRKSVNAVEVGLVMDVPRFLSQCDALVFPAIKPHFGRPIIEANAMALPVIASNVQGNEEVVKNGHNGLLVDANNPLHLAERINILCRSKAQASRMGKNGRMLAEKMFSAKKNANEILNIYREILFDRKITNAKDARSYGNIYVQ